MSKNGYFPLEYIVHIDPDEFKRMMPEYDGYKNVDVESAGTNCHRESGFIQEIATTAALNKRQNIWIDGSLSDGEWYSKIIHDQKINYPH